LEGYLYSLINEVLEPIWVTSIDCKDGIVVLWVDKGKYNMSWEQLEPRLSEEIDIYFEYILQDYKEIKGWEFYD